MKKKLALGLLALLIIFAVPSLSVAGNDFAVDEFLSAGLVTTEAAAGPLCPVPSLQCTALNQDCGVVPGVCRCKGRPKGPWACIQYP